MAKKKDGNGVEESYREYLEVLRLQKDSLERTRVRKQNALLILSLGYALVAGLLFSSFDVISVTTSTLSTLGRDSGETNQINDLKDKVSGLEQDAKEIRVLVAKLSTTSASVAGLETQLEQVQSDQKKLLDSLLLNPDDIVTARLLVEKIVLQDERIENLNDSIRRLDGSLDKIMWSIVILPILSILGLLIKDRLLGKGSYPDVGVG